MQHSFTKGIVMRISIALAFLVLAMQSVAEAGLFRRNTRGPSVNAAKTVARPVQVTPVAQSTNSVATVQPAQYSKVVEPSGIEQTGSTEVSDALAEVNAARARRGLKPFLHDPQLTQAAQQCAQIRASRRIAGHLANDFAYLPAGATARSAGCGAMEPSWGWGTCCTYENYTYAGAAWVMGSDGKRYMHLFVR